MPSSVATLLAAAGKSPDGSVRWGDRVPILGPGVYLVSLHQNPAVPEGRADPQIDPQAIQRWIDYVPGLRLDGRTPSAAQLAMHLGRWWLPQESVLYIGKATSLAKRVTQYYRTPLGAARPHKGGYWIKTLAGLQSLTVHYASTPDAASAGSLEDDLLSLFLGAATPPLDHPEPALSLPFPNLTLDRPAPRRRRKHLVTGACA